MGLREFDPSLYELDYVPQRLRSLDVCILACFAALNGSVNSTPLSIDLGCAMLESSDLRVFIDIAIDAGLVANRTLLNFMGIKLDNGGLVNDRYGLTIEEYGLSLTPVSDAINTLSPEIPSTELGRIWTEALNTASKSVTATLQKRVRQSWWRDLDSPAMPLQSWFARSFIMREA